MTFNSSAESPANTVLQSGLPFFVGRFQAHHIIPVATFGKTQTADSIGSFLLAMGINSEDTATNRLWLPVDDQDALLLGGSKHSGSHDRYTAFVEAKLEEIKAKYGFDIERGIDPGITVGITVTVY